MRHKQWLTALNVIVLVLGTIFLSTICRKEKTYVPPPPPTVTVSRPVQQTVIDYLEFTGTTEAVESVEIRARVEGYLQSIHFKDGARVRKGDHD
jgi:multidrug efflux pump subunit AcrA (membrane-fusion protein)